MGLDPATLAVLIPALGQVGSSVIGGALAPSPFQERKSFQSTTADPVSGLTGIQKMLTDILGPQMTKVMAGSPTPGIDTSDLSLPSFTGGGMAMPIGVTTARQAGGLTRRAAALPGTPYAPPNAARPNNNPGGYNPPVGGGNPGPPTGGNPSPRGNPPDGSPEPGTTGPTGAPQAFTVASGMSNVPDGLDASTYGAIQLLMHAMKGPGGVSANGYA